MPKITKPLDEYTVVQLINFLVKDFGFDKAPLTKRRKAALISLLEDSMGSKKSPKKKSPSKKAASKKKSTAKKATKKKSSTAKKSTHKKASKKSTKKKTTSKKSSSKKSPSHKRLSYEELSHTTAADRLMKQQPKQSKADTKRVEKFLDEAEYDEQDRYQSPKKHKKIKHAEHAMKVFLKNKEVKGHHGAIKFSYKTCVGTFHKEKRDALAKMWGIEKYTSMTKDTLCQKLADKMTKSHTDRFINKKGKSLSESETAKALEKEHEEAVKKGKMAVAELEDKHGSLFGNTFDEAEKVAEKVAKAEDKKDENDKKEEAKEVAKVEKEPIKEIVAEVNKAENPK
jgi:hypothetical protein